MSSALSRVKMDLQREEKIIGKLQKEIETLEAHTCHTCGQSFHDDKHTQVLSGKQRELEEAKNKRTEFSEILADIQAEMTALGEIGKPVTTFYTSEEDAYHHRSSLDNLQKQILEKSTEQNPFSEQIEEMSTQALQIVDYDILNNLTKLQEHQDFLLKLLTSKDSFIRKKIIEQNLSYLNSRLTYYLDKVGLPHSVLFQNDLSVSIEELGRELDFDNLSRGERNRLILSIAWAFRDVFESLYTPINLLFVDEMIDNGLDTQGVEASLSLLKQMSRDRNKSIWLVSHRDELTSRVENILKVIKVHGFTNFSQEGDTA